MLLVPPPTQCCDCCGLPIAPNMGDSCPRCGYPVRPAKEELFLQASIQNLQRVATHGGARITVEDLLRRYRTRLNILHTQYPQPAPQRLKEVTLAEIAQAQGVPNPSQVPMQNAMPPVSSVLPVSPVGQVPSMPRLPVPPFPQMSQPAPQAPQAAQPMFSLRSFLADQTINIVSTLGAFLILIGSLSFVITTTNLLLSFLVLFFVHVIFATVGFVFHRFDNYRFISRIYLAIFALLVPLVSFAGYRLVLGHLVPLSVQTIIVIAAVYAAIVYTILTVTQQFKPFGYLAGVALLVADVACANALHLAFWWWPILLAPLAFAALFALDKNSSVFRGNYLVLREPVLALMYLCIGILGLSFFVVAYDVVSLFVSNPEEQLASVLILLLTLSWTILYWRSTKRNAALAFVPYQFLGFVGALAILFKMDVYSTSLLFAGVAALYQVGRMLIRDGEQQFRALRGNTLGIILAIVVMTSFPFALELFYALSVISQMPSGLHSFLPSVRDTLLISSMYIVCCVVTISIVLHATGLRRIPDVAAKPWSWLLLLSGLFFMEAYSESMLLFPIAPQYSFLALTLLTLVGAILLRRDVSAYWAYPLEVLVLAESLLTLVYQHAGLDNYIALVLFFALLSYGVILYQQRSIWLFIPFIFALLALPALLVESPTLLVLSVALPLAGVVYVIIEHRLSGLTNFPRTFLLGREWPLLASGLLYGASLTIQDSFLPVSTIQRWAHMPFSFALELACFALLWYIVAILTRKQVLLFVATSFAFATLLVPSHPLWLLAITAFIALLIASGIERVAAKTWAIPLYLVSLLAAVLLGGSAYTTGQLSLVTWLLLWYAIVLYTTGVMENFQPFIWVATAFALWSEYDAFLLGNVYSLFVTAVLCAIAAIGIGYLAQTGHIRMARGEALRRFALPFYSAAALAMVLTGVYGLLNSIDIPFSYAVPGMLLFYALVIYTVLVFEQRRGLLWLVVVPSFWGMVLVLLWNALTFQHTGSSVVPVYYLTSVAFITTCIGLLAGRLQRTEGSTGSFSRLAWNWPWYASAIFAVVATLLWNSILIYTPFANAVVYGSLFVFVLLTIGVMLAERRREPFLLVVVLVLWGVAHASVPLWQQLGAISVFFFLLFVAKYVLNFLPTRQTLLELVYNLLIWGGQLMLLLIAIGSGGLNSDVGHFGYTGIGILVLFALQLFWYGYNQRGRQQIAMYVAGLCIALAASWELVLLNYTRIDILTVVPASYLIVISPFLARNSSNKYSHRLGQISGILGATLLLLPTLWSSFNDMTIVPTVLLAGEAGALLLLGVVLRTRFFVLSGTGLIIVSAIHTLFLPTLGLPPSLALTIAGAVLLAIATILSLTRHRLQSVWKRFDEQV